MLWNAFRFRIAPARWLSALVAAVAALAVTRPVQAAAYLFTEVARTDAVYGDLVTGPALNNAGTVAFRHVAGGVEGIYTATPGGLLVPVATTAGGTFARFTSAPDLNDLGAVAFHAIPAVGGEGIYLAQPGLPLQTVADTAGGPFRGFHPDVLPAPFPSVNNAGVVVASGVVLEGGQRREALLRYEGGVRTIPVTAQYLVAPDVNNRGDIAFIEDQVLYVRDAAGTMTGIDSQSGGQINFTETLTLNDRGAVAYGTTFPGPNVIVFDGGRYTQVFRFAVPDGGVALNDLGDLAVITDPGDSNFGIYTGAPLNLERVVGIGGDLLGSTVTSLSFSREGFNNAGQLAFWAALADGRNVIVLATPVPEPAAAGLLLLAVPALLLRRARASRR